MKYEIVTSKHFRKDIKLAQKRGCNLDNVRNIIKKLANGETLEAKYRDHLLTGNYAGFRKCHVTPDYLLVYKIKEEELILFLFRTGTHSDLF